MRIIHYLHGLPPVRTGGLVTYALDLATCQRMLGYDVYLLLPGHPGKKAQIPYVRENGNWKNIPVFRIENALPVPMGKGIKCPQLFLRHVDSGVFSSFWDRLMPDVVHVHSLMGLPPTVIQSAVERDIKTILTTHDYFGLCCRPDRIDYQGKNCYRKSWDECQKCSVEAYSFPRMYFEQTDMFSELMEHSWFSSFLETLAISRKHASVKKEARSDNETDQRDYSALYEQYRKLLQSFRIIHYNSRQSWEIYHRLCPELMQGYRIPMCAAGITDQRRTRYYRNRTLRFGFLGNNSYYKGLKKLLDAADRLLSEKFSFTIRIFCENPYGNRKYLEKNSPFSQSEVDEVYDSFDVLIVPSICEETFSLVVLEALSRAIPCVISDKVGAKDLLLETGGGAVYYGADGLKDSLERILNRPELLEEWNRNIMSAHMELDYKKYVEKLTTRYYR